MHKDLRLALDSARDLGVPLPSTVVADEMLGAARALGYEHRDIAVLFQVLSELDGVRAGSERGVAIA
jgi:3-hydroxyisobutyrate dehydrogenase-like beta-hydroxyacid dehydrogenase